MSKKSKKKKKKTDYCVDCNALCCRYFTVPLDEPEDDEDFDAFRWYILHKGVSIFIDDEGDWFVAIQNDCGALGKKNLCKVYDRRPEICRRHNEEVCEKDGTPYTFREHFFSEKELMAYARKHLARLAETRRRRSEAAKRAWRRRKAAAAADQ